MSRRIPCVLMRAGTSGGPFLIANDLPTDPAARDAVLMRIMGSPDALQLDGLGGGKSITSKVAIVSPSNQPDPTVRRASLIRTVRRIFEGHVLVPEALCSGTVIHS